MYNTSSESQQQCTQCDKAYSYKVDLTVHLRIHVTKLFHPKQNLQTILEITLAKNPISVNDVTTPFSLNGNLIMHLRRHPGEKPYQCSHYKNILFKNYNLMQHLRIHTGEKPYQPYMCDKAFK